MSNHWTRKNIPDLTGKIFIVTGANSGLGYETTLALSEKNATVIMAVRNMAKGEAALDKIKQHAPSTTSQLMQLDLADLESVREFATNFKAMFNRLDGLVNNAGLMATPESKTADGFEMQFGVNHLGHFALTGLLLDPLMNTPGSRVVTVSSNVHYMGKMTFDNLNREGNYNPWTAYGQSKLANLLFTLELQKRFERAGVDTIATAAHPGYAATELQDSTGNRIMDSLMDLFTRAFAQSAEKGALPQLYATVSEDVVAGGYYGPHLMMRGYPKKQTPSQAARNQADAERLWQESVKMTGVTYDALERTPEYA